MHEHEQAFIDEFILPEKRDRYRNLLSSMKRRSKFRSRIAHDLLRDLDSRYLFEQGKPIAAANSVRRLLHAQSPNALCYVMCEYAALDGQQMTLAEAERQWDGLCGILISIVPGQLVYYCPERPSRDYILLKEKP